MAEVAVVPSVAGVDVAGAAMLDGLAWVAACTIAVPEPSIAAAPMRSRYLEFIAIPFALDRTALAAESALRGVIGNLWWRQDSCCILVAVKRH